MVTRREALIGAAALGATALQAPAAPKRAFGVDDHWAHGVCAQLSRRFGGRPPPGYGRRLEEELAVIHRRGWQPWFDAAWSVCGAARASGVVVHHDWSSLTGSLVAHVLGITTVDPVLAEVPFGRMRFSPNDPHVQLAVCARASAGFMEAVAAAAPQATIVAAGKGDGLHSWLELRFRHPHVAPVVHLVRLPELEVVQRAVDRGMPLSGIDAHAVSQLRRHLGPLPPPFDTAASAWVLDSCSSVEDLAAALRLMQVERASWVDDDQRLDWWRLFFAGGGDAHPACEPYLRSTRELLLYQEQVDAIAHDLAGVPCSELHHLRRALGTRHPTRLAFWRDRFLRGARLNSALGRAEASGIFDFLQRHTLLAWARHGAVGETALFVWRAQAIRYLGEE